jgi:zinc-ribbon domain
MSSNCPNCGARLARSARFCPQCGERVGGDSTEVLEVPPDETGPVPVSVSRSEARFYGVTPSTAVLVLGGAVFAVAIFLVVSGHWPVGLILLGVAVLLVLLFLETARRKPTGTVSRSSAEALDTFRARARVAAGSLSTRGRATRRLYALRREIQRMAVLRGRLLFELGDAVYRADEQATEDARGRVEELDRLAAEREAEMQQTVEATQHVLARRRLEVQPTEVSEQPQEPATPAPGELNPPEPARIPEPYPPPDEGSPPQPAVIPEPGPAVIPEPGPQGKRKGKR